MRPILLFCLLLGCASVRVTRVVDGDTLHVSDHGVDVVVRVLGIDCPEPQRNARCRRLGPDACTAQLPAGRAASARAHELLRPGDPVALAGERRDRYGRRLATVRMRDGRDFGETMVQEGRCATFR